MLRDFSHSRIETDNDEMKEPGNVSHPYCQRNYKEVPLENKFIPLELFY